MSNITIRQVADAVAAELNAGEFATPFTAVRRRIAVFDIEDLAGLTVSVIPISNRSNLADRGRRWLNPQVDIAVQQHLGTNTDPQELDQLLEDIDEYLYQRARLTSLAGPRWVESQLITPNDPSHLDEMNTFTAVLRVTYRMSR